MVEQRARSIQGLPGRAEDYPDTLFQLLEVLAARDMRIGHFTRWIMGNYGTTESSAKSVLYNALRVLGFVECDGTSVGLTEAGRGYLEDPDPARIGAALQGNLIGVGEILDLLRERPRPISSLHDAMRERGFDWQSDWQIRYRLKWLRTAGLVTRLAEAESAGRYPEWAPTQPSPPAV